jgi:hypothetical protein
VECTRALRDGCGDEHLFMGLADEAALTWKIDLKVDHGGLSTIATGPHELGGLIPAICSTEQNQNQNGF